MVAAPVEAPKAYVPAKKTPPPPPPAAAAPPPPPPALSPPKPAPGKINRPTAAPKAAAGVAQSATGVAVADNIGPEFEDMKLHRSKLKWILYEIVDGMVVTHSNGTGPFEEFQAQLPPDDCRYGVVDVKFDSRDGRPQNKLAFISW